MYVEYKPVNMKFKKQAKRRRKMKVYKGFMNELIIYEDGTLLLKGFPFTRTKFKFNDIVKLRLMIDSTSEYEVKIFCIFLSNGKQLNFQFKAGEQEGLAEELRLFLYEKTEIEMEIEEIGSAIEASVAKAPIVLCCPGCGASVIVKRGEVIQCDFCLRSVSADCK